MKYETLTKALILWYVATIILFISVVGIIMMLITFNMKRWMNIPYEILDIFRTRPVG